MLTKPGGFSIIISAKAHKVQKHKRKQFTARRRRGSKRPGFAMRGAMRGAMPGGLERVGKNKIAESKGAY